MAKIICDDPGGYFEEMPTLCSPDFQAMTRVYN